MTSDNTKIKKWFKEKEEDGYSYEESIYDLIAIHDTIKDKSCSTNEEKELYEHFVYMDEDEWYSLSNELKSLFNDKGWQLKDIMLN